MPEAAYAEDGDSDGNTDRRTRVQARRSRGSSVKPKTVERPASDSGYSSQSGVRRQSTSASQLANVGLITTAKSYAVVPGASRGSKPVVVHRSESRSSRQPVHSRSGSVSRASATCTDLYCQHASCVSSRNPERRYTLPQQQQWAAYQQQQQQYQQAQQAQYAPPSPTRAMPMVNTQQRPPLAPTTRTRPVSIHGYGAVSYSGMQHGPPPSPSAYHNMSTPYYPAYPQPTSYLGTTPPNPMPSYAQTPIVPSPTSPTYGTAPGLARTYSARAPAPVPGHSPTKVSARHPVQHTISARRHVPGAYESASESESESESDSTDSEFEREEYEREERERRRRALRERERMPPPRRPSTSQRRPEIIAPPRISQSSYHRTRSDTSYDNADSDRTVRPTVNRARTDSSYSARSRRQSVSTTASSGRTPATTVSEGSQRVIIEDGRGRRVAYLPSDVRDDLIRRYQQQKLGEADLKDRIEAYQNVVRGGQAEELTAANIERIKTGERRTSGSHVSSHHSRKTSSSKASKTDGIRIEAGGTVLQVYGSANVEMQPGEGGGPARFIINNATGGDSTYGGSKSSGSRRGRSRGGSDFGRIREEEHGGYERAL